ncbi:unnamed protein product [Linum trigynum]|uniref:CCHC-type domain-containing protein n=1 Tax=Linum trigynum TaxID=586398 RepID=A0AAV2FUN4_9ROSI
MSLSSVYLTETFFELSNGSFPVPFRGTSTAQSKGNCNEYLAKDYGSCRMEEKQGAGRGPQSPTSEAPKGMGQYRGSSVQLFGKGTIWKPPDLRENIFQCQNNKRRRGKRGSRRSRKISDAIYGTNWGQEEGILEPRAPATDGEKQRMGRISQEEYNECFDRRGNHPQQEDNGKSRQMNSLKEGREAYLRRRSHKEDEEERRVYACIKRLQIDSPFYLKIQLLYPEKTQPFAKFQLLYPVKTQPSEIESYLLLNMETNRSLISSSSKGREGRPNLSSSGGRGIAMLLGKMLTENKVALAKAAGAARYAWGGYGEVNVQPTDSQNLFLFTFNNEETRERIWRDRPWSLSNTLTAIEKYNGRGKPEDTTMEKLAMWVQIHGLHQNQRIEKNMVSIGTYYFQGLLDIDRASLDFNGYRRFLRILVEVNLEEPVPTGFDFPFTDEATGIEHCDVIEFKYERLVELCYFCGRIGHNWPSCWRMNEERRKNGVAYLSDIYNSSLKAGIDSPHRQHSSSNRSSREGGRNTKLVHWERQNKIGKCSQIGRGRIGRHDNGRKKLGGVSTDPAGFYSPKVGTRGPRR